MSMPGAIMICGRVAPIGLGLIQFRLAPPPAASSSPSAAGGASDRYGQRRRRGRPQRYDGECDETPSPPRSRGQHEENLVHVVRDDVFLEEDLEPVGDRLKHAARTEPIRPDAVLHVGRDLALGVDQIQRPAKQAAHRRHHDDQRREQMLFDQPVEHFQSHVEPRRGVFGARAAPAPRTPPRG